MHLLLVVCEDVSRMHLLLVVCGDISRMHLLLDQFFHIKLKFQVLGINVMVLKDYLFHVLRVDTMIGWNPGRLLVLSALFG